MINDENKTEQIDRYLDEEMMPAEKVIFEKLINEQQELRREVEAQKAIRAYLNKQGEKAELRRLMEDFHQSINQSQREELKQTQKIDWTYWAVAASIVLAIVSTWLIVKENNLPSDKTEIRTGNQTEVFAITMLVWETNNDKRIKKQETKINTVIINDLTHRFHYRFTNTLELYWNPLPKPRPQISLEYDNDTRRYKLWIDKRPYFIQKTDSILPL